MALSLKEFRKKYPQYDNVDDDTLSRKLHEKYYAHVDFEVFNSKFRGAVDVPTGGDVTEFGEKVLATRDKPAPEMRPSLEEISDSPERAAHVAEHGTWEEQADKLRAQEGLTTEEEQRQKASRDALTLSQSERASGSYWGGFGEERTPEEQAREIGKLQRRLIDLGIRNPQDYGYTQDEFDALTAEVVTEEQLRKQKQSEEAAAAAERGDYSPEAFQEGGRRAQEAMEQGLPESDIPEDDPERGWWNFTKAAVSSIPSQIRTGLQLNADTIKRIEEQDLSIGQVYLERLNADLESDEETREKAGEILDEAAAKYGMQSEDYMKYTGQMVDLLTANERDSLDEYSDIIENVQSFKPRSAEDTWVGHIGAMVIENVGQIGYIGAGVATRNPAVTMTLMGTDIYARTYASARAEGRDPSEAAQDAFAAAAIEGATEGVPVGKFIDLMKAGAKSKARKVLEGLATEGAQEVLAEAGQIGYEIGLVGKEMTWGEAFARLRDAGVVGMVIGGAVSAPVALVGDNDLDNASRAVNDAVKDLQSVTRRMMNPDMRVTKEEVDSAREGYRKAVQAKAKLIEQREEAKKAKAEGKQKKKAEKRRKKMTAKERARDEAREAAEKADQTVTEVTEQDVFMANTMDRIIAGEVTKEDAKGVESLLDAGYAKIMPSGAVAILPAGRRRLKAVREAQERPAVPEVEEDEIITPTPYERPEARQARQAVDEEIGRLIRGEEIIEPQRFKGAARRKLEIAQRVDKKVKDPKVVGRIADDIIKADQVEAAYEQREAEQRAEMDRARDDAYSERLREQNEIESEVALNLARMDQRSRSGYKGTRLGDVLRNAYRTLEREEAKASEALRDAFWNKPQQGVLFDVGGALAKGTADYANLVKVGALKIAKIGLKYSAWSSDMVGEFGESVKPVLARVWHDAKKRVRDVMRISHEKFQTGKRKGELKYAPKKYAKPGKLQLLRRTLERLAKEGERGKLWYEKSGRAILKATGGNKAEARKLAGLLAIYSSGTAVSANLTNALKMWSMWKGGDTKLPKRGTKAGRFGEQDRTAIEWLESDQADEYFVEKFGDKRYPFFTNLMREIDPENYELGQGATIDLWMVRAFGYDREAPTTAQFAFATTEIKNLAERLGWENQQVQAAIWVAIKARWEFIQKEAKAKAVERGLASISVGAKGAEVFEVEGATREEQIENQKKIIELFREIALKKSVKEINKKLDDSAQDFADYMEKHYATISWEAEPSTSLGLNFDKLPLRAKLALQARIASILTNPKTGREFIAERLGLLGAEQFTGPGSWDMKVGAATQSSVIAPPEHKKRDQVQAKTVEALNGYTAILGYLMKQDAVAWHRPFYATTMKSANGAEIVGPNLRTKETREFYGRIVEVAEEKGLSAEVASEWAPIVLDGAVRVLNFNEAVSNRDFHKIVEEAANRSKLSGNMELFSTDGNLAMNDWVENPRGESYVDQIDQLENEEIKKTFEWAKRKFGAAIAEVYQEYADKYQARTEGKPVAVPAKSASNAPADGFLRFRHFSTADPDTISTEYFGTGIRGAERKRNPVKVISAYPDKMKTKKEVGLGPNEFVIDVPESRMYNLSLDPLNLKALAQEPQSVNIKGEALSYRTDMTKWEQAIQNAGFDGYYTPDAEGILEGQARFFTDISVIRDDSDVMLSVSDPVVIQVRENELDEFEVPEKDGEIYFATDPDDAVNTARSIHGDGVAVEFVDEFGERVSLEPPRVSTPDRARTQAEMEDVQLAVDEFMEELFEETWGNPLNPDERIIGAESSISIRSSGGEIWLDSIRAFDTSQGAGNKALKFVLELADKHGVTLNLFAEPFGERGLSRRDLVKWYERNGFYNKVGKQYSREPQNQAVPTIMAMFRKPKTKTAEGYGLPAKTVQAYLDRFGELTGITNLRAVQAVEDLPTEAYMSVAMRGHADAVNGLYYNDPVDGPTIYIVSNHMYSNEIDTFGQPDVNRMVETVLHEAVGHYGTRALLGDKMYNRYMDQIIKSFPQDVERRRKQNKFSNTVLGRRLAAEEVVAYMAQDVLNGAELSKVKVSLLDRIMDRIRLLLAEWGLGKFTRDDLLSLIWRSADFTRRTSPEILNKRAQRVQEMLQAQKDAKASNAMASLREDRKDDPELDRFLNKIGHGRNSRMDRLKDWWEVRRGRLMRIFEIEVLDQFAGIKHAEQDLGGFGTESGYMSVRLSAGIDVILRSALENGVPVWDAEGTVSHDPTVKGLVEILAPVGQSGEMLQMFEAFIVARRAKRLTKEQRERLITKEEIAAVYRYIRKNKLYRLFNQTQKDMAQYKKRVLDFAEEAGLIDADTRPTWEHSDHVPFYRVLAKDKTGPFAGSRIGQLGTTIRRLKGGTETLRNPLESIVQNIGMLIEASVKNRAMADVVRNFDGTGLITKAPQAETTTSLVDLKQIQDMLDENGVSIDAVGRDLLQGIKKLYSLQAPTADNIVSVHMNGKKQYYYVHDTGIMRGLEVNPRNWEFLMKALRTPKRVLTRAITLTPDFILKNWFRDMWHSWVLSRHGHVAPFYDSAKGWGAAVAQNEVYRDIMAGGGMFDAGYVNASDPNRTNIAIRKSLMGAGRSNILDSPRKLAKFYMRLANGAENAHRIAVYQKTLKRTGSRKQALFESRDLMDFSVRGANPIVRFLTETVPFWGARVQGIARSGKGLTEAPMLTLMRAAPIVLASVALYALNRDDERYKGLPEYEKRMYYHFFGVFDEDDHWRLPKPFEVGALFSSVPETLTELMMSEEPDRMKAAGHSLFFIVREMLSLWPDVQAINPLYELAINEDRFTESPILTDWEKKKDPAQQYSYRTPATVRELAQSMPDWAPDAMRSPKQLEHLLRGYFGSMMDYALVMSDEVYYKTLAQDEALPPSMRWDETPFVRAFRRDTPAKYDVYLDTLYETLEEADKIYNAINDLKKEGDREGVVEYREKYAALLYARGPMNRARKQLRDINANIKKVYESERLTPTEKRERIDELLKRRSDVAQKVYDYRPGGKKNKEDGGEAKQSFLDSLIGQEKAQQIDKLVAAELPHTAILINDIRISEEKLRKASA